MRSRIPVARRLVATLRALVGTAIAASAVVISPALPASDDAVSAHFSIESDAELAVMRYAASCALPAGEAVRVRRGAEVVVLGGELGFVPEFFRNPQDESLQRQVSACVLARVNRDGRQVRVALIPARELATLAAPVDAARAAWLEGAFFGNVFAEPQRRYVCSNAVSDPAAVRALEHGARWCALPEPQASGTSRCGFIHLGRCDAGAFRRDGVDYRDSAIATRFGALGAARDGHESTEP